MFIRGGIGMNTSAGKKTQDNEFRAQFWQTAKRVARHVPFMDQVVAAYFCAMDKQTPLRAKGILLAALAYFVLPADAIPDLIVGIGFTDDIGVLTAAITTVRAHMKPSHLAAARDALQQG